MTIKEFWEKVNIDEDMNYIIYRAIDSDICIDLLCINVDSYDNCGFGERYVNADYMDDYNKETGEYNLICNCCFTLEDIFNKEFVHMRIDGCFVYIDFLFENTLM